MATPNFSALLSKPAGEAKAPPVLPEGTYYGVIASYGLDEKKRQDKMEPFVKFKGTLTHAHEDVVLEDENGSPIDVSGRPFPGRFAGEFSFNDEYLYILDNFLRSLGIEMEGRSYSEILPQVVGQSVMVQVSQRPYTDQNTGETRMVNDTQRMSAVPA